MADQGNAMTRAKATQDEIDLEKLSILVRNFMEPLASSQSAAQHELTERARIEAGTTHLQVKVLALLVGAVITVSGIALFTGSPDLTEKVLIAVVSFAGGFGVGKAARGRGHA